MFFDSHKKEEDFSSPLLSTTFETNTRQEFIKASHLIAKGLDITSRHKTIISVACLQYGLSIDAGKSLIADSMLHFHDPNKETYDIPHLKHMSLEEYPQQALEKPLQHHFKNGKNTNRIDFTRYDYQSRRFSGEADNILTIISHSEFRGYGAPDCEIELKIPSETSQKLHRQWTVRVFNSDLYAPMMLEQIEHLRNFHERRLYKSSLGLR